MPTPRKQLISLADTPNYHIVSRCVRRSWLCGVDPYNGKDYSYRRDWIIERLNLLASAFAIDVSAYAIMSNHTHLVLHINAERAKQWSREEVISQWHIVYSGNLLSQRFSAGKTLSSAELAVLDTSVENWRERLHSISQFMSALNEHIARLANTEDKVTGKFWESRFKSQALLDETAKLSAMVYCDLNPVRAGMADTPESSDYTSIQERIIAAGKGRIPDKLYRFQGHEKKGKQDGIPCTLKDYIALVDATGRIIREDKRGAIDAGLNPILQRLNIDTDTWLMMATEFEESNGPWVGPEEKLARVCERTKKKWICNTPAHQKLHPTSTT